MERRNTRREKLLKTLEAMSGPVSGLPGYTSFMSAAREATALDSLILECTEDKFALGAWSRSALRAMVSASRELEEVPALARVAKGKMTPTEAKLAIMQIDFARFGPVREIPPARLSDPRRPPA